jgi:hypothetical protein
MNDWMTGALDPEDDRPSREPARFVAPKLESTSPEEAEKKEMGEIAESAKQIAMRLLDQAKALEKMLIDSENNPVLLDIETRVKLLRDLSMITARLGKTAGVGLTLSTRAILASPNWAHVCDRVLGALAPYPDALRAVAEATAVLKADG